MKFIEKIQLFHFQLKFTFYQPNNLNSFWNQLTNHYNLISYQREGPLFTNFKFSLNL